VSKSNRLKELGARYGKLTEGELREYVSLLPRDLDGDPYVIDETLGPWKVSHCCGAFAKGIESGICCRRCYRDVYDDGPAMLSEDQERGPAAYRITLPEVPR
jgi:hypothetical protein